MFSFAAIGEIRVNRLAIKDCTADLTHDQHILLFQNVAFFHNEHKWIFAHIPYFRSGSCLCWTHTGTMHRNIWSSSFSYTNATYKYNLAIVRVTQNKVTCSRSSLSHKHWHRHQLIRRRRCRTVPVVMRHTLWLMIVLTRGRHLLCRRRTWNIEVRAKTCL